VAYGELNLKYKVFYLSDLHYSKHVLPTNVAGNMADSFHLDGASSGLNIFSWFKSHLQKNKHVLKKEFETILFFITGDLTDRGNADGLKKCEKFLVECCDILEIPKTNIIVAPGNHDVQKVQNLDEQWKNFRDFTGEFTTPFNTSHFYSNDAILVVPVNSINLGVEKRKRLFRKDHIKLIEVPVVDVTHIARFNEICDGRSAKLKIVLLHSHLLPVYSIDGRPYDIITNAGIFIKELQKQTVSLILHGHKHTYSAKVLQDFEANENPLPMVVIGSKEFSANGGFSEIEIEVQDSVVRSVIFSRKVFENGDVKDSGKISDLLKYINNGNVASNVVTVSYSLTGVK